MYDLIMIIFFIDIEASFSADYFSQKMFKNYWESKENKKRKRCHRRKGEEKFKK